MTYNEMFKLFHGYISDNYEANNFLYVYVAGHGFMKDNMQYFCLNSLKDEKSTFPIEERLRIIAEDAKSCVLVFYDCCRSKRSSVPD